MPRTVAVLPEDEQNRLRAVRESEDLVALRQHVLALRLAKWPLRAIGDPLGAPRSTVRMWESNASPTAELPNVPECPRAARERGERVVRLPVDVPPEDRDKLKVLAQAARRVRGRTPVDSPDRIAANQLDTMIESYIVEREIAVKRIAEHMGVTPRAVAARYERFVARKTKKVDA